MHVSACSAYFCVSETGFCSVAQAGPELMISLLQLLESWNYRCVLLWWPWQTEFLELPWTEIGLLPLNPGLELPILLWLTKLSSLISWDTSGMLWCSWLPLSFSHGLLWKRYMKQSIILPLLTMYCMVISSLHPWGQGSESYTFFFYCFCLFSDPQQQAGVLQWPMPKHSSNRECLSGSYFLSSCLADLDINIWSSQG